jgi:4-amino-4-deoxy-L-arabinose transferase-like glycosyltransferase
MVIKTNKWSVLMILVICAITFFVNNRTFTPDIMEARNIVTAREMVQDGHWMVPTMNGELRLEKPPLPTWITAVTEYHQPRQPRAATRHGGYSRHLARYLLLSHS